MEFRGIRGTLFCINENDCDALRSALHSLGDVKFVIHRTSDLVQSLALFQLDRVLSDSEIIYLILRAGIELRPEFRPDHFSIMFDYIK